MEIRNNADKKNNIKQVLLYAAIIFAAVFLFRAYFALTDPNFTDGSAYTNLRNIDSVLVNHHAIYYDELSYSGRDTVGPSLFYYLMALFSFGGIFLLKIIPEALFAIVSVLVFLIGREMTGDDKSALLAGIMSGFVPLLVSETINRISMLSLVLPIMLFMFLCSLKLEERLYLWGFVACSFLLPFISAWSLLFVLAMMGYLFILGGGILTPPKVKKEAILFSGLLILLINLIVYKKALFQYGFSLVWQNIPANILADSFRQLNPIDIVLGVGLIPLLFGGIGLYQGIIKEKSKPVYLFGGFTLAVLLLLVLKLISLADGLLFLGVLFSIFSAVGLKWLFGFFGKSKAAAATRFIVLGILALVLFFSVLPSYNNARNSRLDAGLVNDFKWAEGSIDGDSAILGNIYEGELITGIAKHKNVADMDFLLAPNSMERLQDIGFIYSTWSEAKALELIKKYNIKTIYFSEQTKMMYNIRRLPYTDNERCFKKEGNFYAVEC